MKSNNFNYSLLAVGVAAVMGISSGAMAATTQSASGTAVITNIATASYSVGGLKQKDVASNPVVINIKESAAFSLVATNNDGDNDNSTNTKISVIPNGTVVYNHALSNTGNLTDSYKMNLSGLTPERLAAISVTYSTLNADGTGTLTSTTKSGTDFVNSSITLAPGTSTSIVISEKNTNNKGGDTKSLTLTAESDYLSKDKVSDNELATNKDDSITKLPVFSIIKKVTNPLDLNNANDQATYSITVKNDNTANYAADATNIKIVDNLPAGLKLVSGSTITSVVTNLPSGATAKPGTVIKTNNGAGGGLEQDGFEVQGADLPVGATITITFNVIRDTTETLAAVTVNHVRVEDLLDDTPNTTNTSKVIDSTNPNPAGTTNDPAQTTNTYYPSTDDNEKVDGTAPTTKGGDSTGPLATTQRNLTITGTDNKEVPTNTNATTDAKYKATITNTGDQIEGDVAGELKFTITGDTNNDNVNIGNLADGVRDVTVTYNGETKAISPIVTGGNEYDINSVFSGGIPKNGVVVVNYVVKSVDGVIGTSETTTVTLVPGSPGNDNSAPAITSPTAVATTKVEGLSLVKTQGLDANCSGTTSVTSFTTANIDNARPGQCVVYQIVAQNTSSVDKGFEITSLTISDLLTRFSANADFRSGSAISSTNGTGTVTTPALSATDISTTVTALPAQKTATLKFSIKIKPNAATVIPTTIP